MRTARFHVVRAGTFAAFSSSRELARRAGEEFSRGCSRAEGYAAIPIVRIPNLYLLPGEMGSLDDLLADTGEAVFMETNRS